MANLSAATAPKYAGGPVLQAFTERDLPAHPHTRAVAIHPDGLVYVGTIEGLLEFDSVSWKKIQGTSGLIIHNIAITASGRVFYSGAGIFGLLEPNALGVLVAHPLQESLPPADREIGHVLRLVVAGEDAWLATQGPRPLLVRINASGHLATIALEGNCTSLFVHEGAVHFTTAKGAWRILAGSIEPVPAAPAWRTAEVISIWPADHDATWIVSPTGLLRWSEGRASLVSEDIHSFLAGDRITSGCPVGHGHFILGTDAHGLLLVNTAGTILAHYGLNDHDVPISGKISSLTSDKSGGVWITHYGGVMRARFDGPISLHEQPSDMHARVESFTFYQRCLYAATTRGVLMRDESDGRFRLLPAAGMDAWSLVPTEDGLIIAGDDLRLLKPDGGVEIIDAQRLGFRAALRLRREPDRLVASTGPGGGALRLYRKKTEVDGTNHWHFEVDVPGVRMPLYPLIEDEAGWLWGTRNRLKLVRIDWRQGVRLDAKPEYIGPEHGFPETELPTFRVWLFDLDGRVEVCNWEGIWRHDPATDRFQPENRIAGLDAKRWSRAFPLNDGSLWMASSQLEDPAALARRTGPDSWKLELLPRSGLESIRPSAVGDDPATSTWWIGHLGIAAVLKDWQGPDPAPPSAVIRYVTTDANRIVWGGAGPKPTGQLSKEDTSLQFSFAAPFFQADSDGRVNVSYRTRLDGIDAEWSVWGDGTRRDYSNLPPGTFSFRVQARDEARRMGSEAIFTFTRRAPWWRTPWARVAYILLGVAAIAGFVHMRTLQLQSRATALEKIVDDRTAELLLHNAELARLHRLELDQKTAARLAEEQARLETLRYQLNPHFLFNALASVSSMLPADAGAARTMVSRLAEFCRTTLHRDDDREHTTIGEELAQLAGYLEIEKARWGNLLDVAINCGPGLDATPLPHFLLLPIVENAIKYGRATSADGIGVRLDVHREDDNIILAVSNTGKWIEPDQKRHDVPSLGIGLENLRERLARYYPRTHHLEFSHANDWVTVTLRLKVPTA